LQGIHKKSVDFFVRSACALSRADRLGARPYAQCLSKTMPTTSFVIQEY